MAYRAGQRVNYDDIAHRYDEPLRDHPVDPNLIQFLRERPGLQPTALSLLDMGCGTGKQQASNWQQFPNARVVGMDLFQDMLTQARKRSVAVNWIQGDSAQPPFGAASFDYITNQFSYHHVHDKAWMIVSIFRLLKPGGRFVMTNIDPWAMPNWIIYRYFPSAGERDYADYYTADEFSTRLVDAGFVNVHMERNIQVIQEDLCAFLEYASDRYRASQFMAISDDAYALGLATIRAEIARHVDQHTDDNPQVNSELCLVTLSADKPLSGMVS